MLACLLARLIPLAPAQGDAPRSYRPEFGNDRVRVTRVRYAPREKVSSHDHPENPTVYVYLRSSGPAPLQRLRPPGRVSEDRVEVARPFGGSILFRPEL